MESDSKKCRICLQETFTDIISLQVQIPFETERTYAEIYENISGLTPDRGSQYLCKTCTEDLLSSYEFKRKVEQCEKVWGVEIKLELDSEEPRGVTEIEVKPDTTLIFVSTLISEAETIPDVKNEQKPDVDEDEFDWQDENDGDSDDDSMKLESQNEDETCPYCQNAYKSRSRLLKHYKNSHKGASMRCRDCRKEFTMPHQLSKHRRKKHDGDSDIEDKYELKFPTKSNLSEKSKTFECPFCSEIFNTKHRLTQHKKQQHPGQKPSKRDPNEQTVCPECGIMVFVRALERHRRSAHDVTPKETYICDLCNAKLVSKVGMNIHMQLKHLNTTFFCRHCTEMFPTPGIRRTHEIRFHTKNYRHLCHLCDKKFITGVHLRKHLNSHTGEKKFPCETCGMRLSTKDGLKRHQATHSDERPFACEICGLGFKTAHVMRMHMKSHKEWDYECPVCSQKFLVNQALRIHVTRNHPEYQLPPPGTVMNKSAIRKMEEIKAKYGTDNVTVAMLGTNRGNRRNPVTNNP